MTRQHKKLLAALAVSILFARSEQLRAQALPAGVPSIQSYNPGPTLPLINGNYSYSLTASDIAEFGNSGLTGSSGVGNTVALSGSVEYVSPSKAKPFSLLYTGGVLFTNYQGEGTQTFQDLTVSQGLVLGRWAMGVSDSVTYLPQSPTGGISGVAGIGDLGLQPLPVGGAPAQSVLTNYASQVDNFLSGNISRALTGKMTLSGTASYGILDFVGGGSNGLNGDDVTGEVALTRRLNARNNLGINGSYMNFNYPGIGISFNVKSLNLEYDRSWTRSLSTQIAAGPQWQSGFESVPLTSRYFDVAGHGRALPTQPTALTIPIPPQLNLGITAGLTYDRKRTATNVSYIRGVNGGSGVQPGAFADSVMSSFTYNFSRIWSSSAFLDYTRTSGFEGYPPITTELGGFQVSRELGTKYYVYMSYTAISQSATNVLAAQDAFSGLYHMVAVGITYSPRAFHVRHY